MGWESGLTGTKTTVTDSMVNVTGTDAAALSIGDAKGDGNYTLEVTGGSYSSTHGAGLLLYRDFSSFQSAQDANYNVSINNATVEGPYAIQVGKSVETALLTAKIDIGAGSKLIGDVAFSDISNTTLTLTDGTTLTGNVSGSGSAQATVRLKSGSVLTGTVNKDIPNDANQKLDLDIISSTWSTTGSSTLDNLTLDNATINLTLDSLSDTIAVDTLAATSENSVFIDLSNALLSKILNGQEGNGGSAQIDVFTLITGSQILDIVSDPELITFTMLTENAAGSTWTVTTTDNQNYTINGIVLASVPEPAGCVALAGLLVLLVCAMSRSRR
jgi:hypothetical protein